MSSYKAFITRIKKIILLIGIIFILSFSHVYNIRSNVEMSVSSLNKEMINPLIKEKFQKELPRINQLFDEENLSLDAYNYFIGQWAPKNHSLLNYSPLITSFDDSFKEIYFDSWIDNPSYILHDSSEGSIPLGSRTVSRKSIEDLEILEIEEYTETQQIFEKQVISENQAIIETTTIYGRSHISLEEPSFSTLDNISIPVLSNNECNLDSDQGGRRIEIIEKIGLLIDLPSFNKLLTIDLGSARFQVWANFEMRFHFVFPVKLVIEYPIAVIEGASYSFKCMLIPLDLPDYNEFEITILLDTGAHFQFKITELYWKIEHKTLPFGIKVSYPVLVSKPGWKTLVGGSVYYGYHLSDSYETPLTGDSITLDIGNDIDVLPLIPHPVANFLSEFLSIGFNLGKLSILGHSINGDLAASIGNNRFSRTVGWTKINESKSLQFTIPINAGDFIKLSISKLIYHAQNVAITPNLFMSFKNIEKYGIFFPVHDWLGELRLQLPSFQLGGMNIPSTFSYATTGAVIPEGAYDFGAKIIEINPDQRDGTFTNLQPHDQLYQITLRNLGNRTDTMELGVSGLPVGYKATFDRYLPHYDIGSTPTTAILIISPPKQIDVSPGDRNFTLTVTSQVKRTNSLPNASSEIYASLTVPRIVDHSFELEYTPYDIIQVDQDQDVSLKFFGENTGNINDTLFINATLSSNVTLRTWNSTYALEQFGQAPNCYFSGEFGFRFALEDFYPEPGIYKVEIQSRNIEFPIITKKYILFLNFSEAYRIDTSITPETINFPANNEVSFNMNITNLGNIQDNFTLISEGWDEYLTFPREVLYLEPMESDEVTIRLKIPNPSIIPSAQYTYRIKAISEASGSKQIFDASDVDVNVFSPDLVPPGLTRIEPFYTQTDYIYPQSPLTLGPEWWVFDEEPGDYFMYIDEILYEYNIWIKNSTLKVPVTGINPLEIGKHNITIIVQDQSNNRVLDQIWVTIVDSDNIIPEISSEELITLPEDFAWPQTLRWNCSDIFPLNGNILLNDTILPISDFIIDKRLDDSSNWFVEYQLLPNTLTFGLWNYTLQITDMGNNTNSLSIFVNVTSADLEQPTITIIPGTSGLLGHDEILQFTAFDDFPYRYELWINTIIFYNSTWYSNNPLTFNLDNLGLSIGDNNLEIRLIDISNNSYRYSWIFNLQDIDPPTLIESPQNFSLYEHNITFNEIPAWTWHDYDNNPCLYSIYRDGILVAEGESVVGNRSIEVPIRTLQAGTYYFEAYFRDSSGNLLYDSVLVTIQDVLNPYIWPHDPITFEPLFSANWFELVISEAHPDIYILYRNGVEIQSAKLSSDFPIVFIDLSSLAIGNYIYELIVIDESGNIGEENVFVTVTDFTPPLIKRPPDITFGEGTLGNAITWEILEANPYNYSLYRNGELLQQDMLNSLQLTISLDDLELGKYEYHLIVYDQRGLSHSANCHVTVLDLTAPFLNHISDCKFVVGDPNAKLTWIVTDKHPDSYFIKRGTEIIFEETWNGNNIVLPLVGWSIGYYSVHLTVNDTSGNTISDDVFVKIVLEESISTIGKPASFPTVFMIFALIILSFIKVKQQRRKIE